MSFRRTEIHNAFAVPKKFIVVLQEARNDKMKLMKNPLITA